MLEVKKGIPPSYVITELKLDEGTECVIVKRVRDLDSIPWVLTTSILPPTISTSDDFSGSIYKLLQDKYKIQVSSGKAQIEAGIASKEDSELLQIELGAPILLINWLTISDSNIPVEYSISTYPGDRYRYKVELRART